MPVDIANHGGIIIYAQVLAAWEIILHTGYLFGVFRPHTEMSSMHAGQNPVESHSHGVAQAHHAGHPGSQRRQIIHNLGLQPITQLLNRCVVGLLLADK
jgi:hypothetical protein